MRVVGAAPRLASCDGDRLADGGPTAHGEHSLAPLLCARCAHRRLAAQQLGLLSFVPELEEDWAQVEAAWHSAPPPPAGGGSAAGEQQQQPEGAAGDAAGGKAEALPAQPAFRDAALAAASGEAGAEAAGGAPALLLAVEAAPAALQALSPDEFPRLLEWSEGLCGLTLLPLRCLGSPWPAGSLRSGWGPGMMRLLRCTSRRTHAHRLPLSLPCLPCSLFEGAASAAPWASGRPCLAPLGNLWLRAVSRVPPQLD